MAKQSKSGSRSKPRKSKQQPNPFDWRNKPIIEFTELERKRWHDSLGLDIEKPMLDEARSERGSLLIAAAVLILPTGAARLLYHGDEWGDGDGSELPEHMVAIAEQALVPGEQVGLELVEVQMAPDGTCACTVRTGSGVRHGDVTDNILAPGLTKKLDAARHEAQDAEYWLAVLTAADGAKRIVFADHDDGMGEVRQQMAELILRARRLNWLEPGESFDRARLKLRPSEVLTWTVAATMDPVASTER